MMNKRHIVLAGLSTLMAATLGLGVFTACNTGGNEVKPSELVDGVNCYYGDGKDVHLGGWITSVTNDAWTVEENYTDTAAEGSPVVTKLGYSKNDAWRNFGVKIDGEYSDFAYLNITMRAEARVTGGAVNVFLKIVNPVTGREDMNVLGSDLYFDVSTDEYTTYTFEIPSVYRQIMDIAVDVCLFPEPGIANSAVIHAGDIYVRDMWFSKTRPADAVTPVDDTWRTEAWCGYEVTRGGESEAVISYNHPADWSRFYRPVLREEIFLEDGTVNNMLKLQFTSDTVMYGEEELVDSVEQFQFGIWGDPDPGTEAQYHQQWFGQYYRDKYEDTGDWSNNPAVFKVEKDEATGVVTLYCQVAPALMAMYGNFDEQIWIVFNLESQPQGGGSDQAPGYIHGPVEFDGIGQMTILSSEFYYDPEQPVFTEPVVNESGWENNAQNAYTISSEKAGIMANVTYENLSYNLWSCIVYPVTDAARRNTVTLELRNNGEEDVLYGIDLSDEAHRQYGYIPAGETVEVVLQNAAAWEAINFFIDSCYPGYDASVTEGTFSGDIDIVSMTMEDRTIGTPDPDPQPGTVNGWGVVAAGADKYTISEKDGVLANVSYEGVAPDLWANLYRDVAAAERTDIVEIMLHNNGTTRALYGIDLADEPNRQYGWLEAGETKTVTLTNTASYTVINFFLDCCYQGDYTTDQTALSGNIDIVSLEFVGNVAPAPDDGLVWGLNNDATLITIDGKVVTLNNVVPSTQWQNVNANVVLSGAGTLTLPITNNTNAVAKFKLCLMDESWAQIGADSSASVAWIEVPVGQTWDMVLKLTVDEAQRAAHMMLAIDCWVPGDNNLPDVSSFTGTVTIGNMVFTPDETQPEEGSIVDLTWTTTADNLSVADKVITVTNLTDGAWQNVSADLTLSGACTLTLPVTNNTNAIAKFKLSVMYNNDQGGWTDLEGSGTTVCWLEIPQGETWDMVITVSAADAPRVAHIMLMVCCWDENGMQADGTTPRPEPPYNGTVTIGNLMSAPDSTQPEEGTVVGAAWGTDARNLSVSGNSVTLNNLPIDAWQNVNTALTLTDACKLTLSITNNTGAVAKFKLQLTDAAWLQIGADSDPCVCWIEINPGETMELTLTVTAEQASQTAHLMLMVDCWATNDTVTGTGEACPAGPYSGTVVLGEIKVS